MAPVGSPTARSKSRGANRTAASRALGRVKVLMFRGRLDAELAAGADPHADLALVIRARQLTKPRYRRRLAASVHHLVEDLGRDPGAYISSAVPFRLDQVEGARATLLALAGALRDIDRVDVRGVAMTLRLITDPASPLYSGTAGALQAAARQALDCLIAGSHPWSDLPAAPPLPSHSSLDEHD